MMPRSSDITKIQKINGVREIRLDRALSEARLAENEAQMAERMAHEKAVQEGLVAHDARQAAYVNPSCAQTRFWQSIAKERQELAENEAEMMTQDRVAASETAARSAAALRVHKIKADRIGVYGKKLRRQEARLTEILAEDDIPSRPAKGVA
jgi:glutaminase